MPNLKIYSTLFALGMLSLFESGCKPTQNNTDSSNTTTTQTSGKYKYETLANDPLGVKIYTLKNGLKVYMSVYKDEPRIQTFIAARTGSRNDPADATGLAHYLEHMLFKGSSKIGALDWEKEKVLLKQISDLYEKHRTAKPEERAAIYAEIDKLSNDAAKLVSANEYDRMISSLGAKGTNAYTSFDQTVYVNDIPSNELDKWLRVESERFDELVLRLFHTELEAVYEEFNISQNRDGRKVSKAFLSNLLPNHPYGTQTTIGTGEHLKTPSMEKIHAYFNTYYVPNNMAIVLSGDFDPDQAVALIEKYFGHYQSKDVPKSEVKPQPEITQPIVKEVFGKEKALVDIGWRLPGFTSDEALMADIVASILSNGKAGLIDLNLVQKQKVGQGSYAFSWGINDFSFFGLYGFPRQGQTLEDVKDLMMAQLDRIRKGDFEEWLIGAVINDMEYQALKQTESNQGRADMMLSSFIYNETWERMSNRYERMRKFTKQQLVDFTNKYIKPTNCVVVYKREGEDKEIFLVEKPKITPVQVNREVSSQFKQDFDKVQSPRQQPVFVDFKSTIQNKALASGVQLDYIKNSENGTFELNYIVDMGTEQDNSLGIALRYLQYLGTDKYTPEQLQEEFFKLGLDFNVYSASDVAYVTLAGLDRSLDKGVELFEHILANIKPDAAALKNLVADVKKERVDAKKSKETILNAGMLSYARFGHNSPFKKRISEKELDALTPEQLVAKIKGLTAFQHKVFYYGSKGIDEVATVLNKFHKVPATLTPCPARPVFTEVPTNENRVVFVDFKGLTQAEIMLVSKGTPHFDLEESTMSRFYNEYFGSGLSSIVFQEIRESRALAYSAYAVNGSPAYKDEAHYYRAFVGTQIDKMKDAIPAMFEIINNLPMADDQLGNALDALLKQIESERITKDGIYWTYRSALKRGLDYDARKNAYDYFKKFNGDVKGLTAALKDFHAKKIKDRKYTILVLSDKTRINGEYLKSLGKYEELTLEDIFGY